MGEFGPTDPSLWLTRPLGYWENQMLQEWPPYPNGPKRCTVNSVTHLKVNKGVEIDVALFRKAVQATIFQEPHLRTDVDLEAKPVTWKPATDFEGVFEFRDLTDTGAKDVEGIRDIADAEASVPWQYGAGKPLYRCVLCRIVDGYVVMNIYHHSAGDGNTGLLIMASILTKYNTLLEGKPLENNPRECKPCIEDLTLLQGEEAEAKKMIGEKKERVKNFSTYLPFDREEFEKNMALDVPLNATVIREGSEENFATIKAACKEHGVTIGNLFLGAAYLAMSTVHAEHTVDNIADYEGMKDQYIDLPVNMRSRLEPSFPDYCGLYITENTTKVSVDQSSTLWSLAASIQKKMGEDFAAKRHLLFSQVKSEWEAGATAELAASRPSEEALDFLLSNMMGYRWEKDFPWGHLSSIHCFGSFWAPGFANYLFLFQSTKFFNYDIVYCPGEKNKGTANRLLDLLFYIIENCGTVKDYRLADLFKKAFKIVPKKTVI